MTSKLGAIVLMVACCFAGLAGCGDPDREACKNACQKLVDCDDPDNGGTGSLNTQWLTSCESACEEADEIAEDVADCLNKTNCADIQAECGTGAN
ncbi:MAG: hypothetical protein C4523_21410 [Myxococcales bacterium]|nr:MAG: hypothetical protein C4523_21410 [Myxococcales bacterium]